MWYFIDDAISSSSDFFGDFIIVLFEVGEVGFDLVVFVVLADLLLFAFLLLVVVVHLKDRW